MALPCLQCKWLKRNNESVNDGTSVPGHKQKAVMKKFLKTCDKEHSRNIALQQHNVCWRLKCGHRLALTPFSRCRLYWRNSEPQEKWKRRTTRTLDNRRKFSSQTSDSLDRWKSRGEQSQRRERASRKKIRERSEDVKRKKMQVRKKAEKSLFTVLLNIIEHDLWPRELGLLKQRVRSHLAK